MNDVRETQIDGVLCFYVDMGSPPSAAHLIFRQGAADEPLHETGFLHLLEHLALRDRETLSRPIEGHTSMLLTRFAAYGGPDAIVRDLGALSRWLGEPDFRLLARQRGVLQAEAQLRRDPLLRSLTWRYGASGAGVASYAEVGALRATEELLTERSRRVFNGSNAVLVLDGPPPTDLRLPLPTGEYHPPRTTEPVRRSLPAAYRDDHGMTLSGVVSRTHEATFLAGMLERAVHDGLRQRTGGAYAPWSNQVEVDDHHVVVAAGSDVVPEILAEVATAGVEVSRRLAEDGVPRAWVQEAVDHRLQRLDFPSALVDVALESAYAVLSDRVPKTHEELLDQLRYTDPTKVDAAAQEFHTSLLLGLPEDAPLAGGVDLVSFPEVRATGHGRRHNHVNWPADLSTFAADAEVAETVHGLAAQRMRIGDVVGLFAWRDGSRLLVGRDGSVLEMEARQWFGGQELAQVLDSAVPDELHLPMPDREVTFRRLSVPARCAIGFARVANTKPGLFAMLGVTALITLWLVLGRHLFLGTVFLLLTAALGAQL
ncbi:MAG TPA: hypothetical protein VGF09_04805, partial [Solirubrobacterales bacterium]